jgi:monofunctional glycosyltransferase
MNTKSNPATGRAPIHRLRAERGKRSLLRRCAIAAIVAANILLIPAWQVLYVHLRDPSPASPRGNTALADVSPEFVRSVWVAEDVRFFEHRGFDWIEIRKAWKEGQRDHRPPRGASTITQQCARSIFLWQGRSWSRKILEAYYTFWMEQLLGKERIFELYINAIELGDGIIGVESAARHFYGIPASDLTREQAAMLVAIMPNPKSWSPLEPDAMVHSRFERILRRSSHYPYPFDPAAR